MKSLAAVCGLLAAAAIGCGSGEPECGNGEREASEECDDGNLDDTDACLSDCRARDILSFTLKWSFNADAAPGFSGDSCTDLGARSVAVKLSGAGGSATEVGGCSFRQIVFQDLAPGSYTAEVDPLDASGQSLVGSPITAEIEVGNGAEVVVDIPPDAWLQSYRGTFFFRLEWDGRDCSAASPPVVEELITLRVEGEVVGSSTVEGTPVDGSRPGPCRGTGSEFPETVLDVPFGAAEIDVVGLGSDGAILYEGRFETFVGAGVNNPELVFDVPARADGGR